MSLVERLLGQMDALLSDATEALLADTDQLLRNGLAVSRHITCEAQGGLRWREMTEAAKTTS